MDSEEIVSDQFIPKLKKRLNGYFGIQYQVNDFVLSGLSITADIDVGNHEGVLAYLKVLQRIGKGKGYSPSYYDCFEEDASFCLDGNSNGIEFLI